ncbi:Indole-3-acetic acid-induced protein ARG7 [Platanthera zijinensis]|uniref:Indole-3-acetic acid-induced protein ARG7 n=1 Tax=Platanthera zijinensis TaxID=2320716 RepID=A0AAP0G996_9ASPA
MSSSRLGKLIASKWRGLASKEGRRRRRKGHFAVYAKGGKRFVVPLSYLDHPIFRVLLEVAEEEFGTVARGPLRVPCEEELMDHLVSLMGKTRHSAGDRAANSAAVL